jgi:PAS domain S-box-containing protein
MTTPEQFIAFADLSPDAIMLSDGEGMITHVNSHACSLFGYDRQELVGMRIEDLVPEEARDTHRVLRSAHEETSRSRPMHHGTSFRGRRKDGSIVPLDISLNPLETASGSRTISVLRDVTRRVRLEDAMRESEERYRSLVELSPEAIVVHAAGVIVYVNEAAVRLFAVASRTDLIGKPILDFTPAEYRDHVRRRIDNPPPAGERGEPILIRSVRPGGEELFLEALGARVTYDGQPAAQVLLRDITARVRAEEEITRSREELRNLSTYLQAARESERTSIAREIHDELGGALTALKMDLATFEDALPARGLDDIRAAIAERVEAMAALIDGTVQTMRRLISTASGCWRPWNGLRKIFRTGQGSHAPFLPPKKSLSLTVTVPPPCTGFSRRHSPMSRAMRALSACRPRSNSRANTSCSRSQTTAKESTRNSCGT